MCIRLIQMHTYEHPMKITGHHIIRSIFIYFSSNFFYVYVIQQIDIICFIAFDIFVVIFVSKKQLKPAK